MPPVVVHPRQALDDGRHSRQAPQVRGKSVRPRAPTQGGVDPRQLPAIEARLAAQSARCLQALPAALAPGVVPTMRRLPTDPQRSDDHRLRLAAGKQSRRLEAARFQGRNIPSPPRVSSHALAWHRTP